MTGKSSHSACNSPRKGFTLVELMTACVIVSIALLGVYVLFRDSVQTERRLTTTWRDRQTAEAIVAQICQTLESAVEIPPVKAAKTGKEDDGRFFLDSLTYGDPNQATLQRRRYRWGGESDVIDLRMIPYSGTRNVAIRQPAEEENPWTTVAPITIARGLKSLSIWFMAVENGEWKETYDYSNSPTLVRVTATVGDVTIERIISSPLTTIAYGEAP